MLLTQYLECACILTTRAQSFDAADHLQANIGMFGLSLAA